jgi:hypothetical protein
MAESRRHVGRSKSRRPDHTSGQSRRFGFVRFRRDSVAKLDEDQLARNIRIEAREFLNQHCALALGLESILRAGPLKIVLQQNRRHCGHEFLRQGRDGPG